MIWWVPLMLHPRGTGHPARPPSLFLPGVHSGQSEAERPGQFCPVQSAGTDVPHTPHALLQTRLAGGQTYLTVRLLPSSPISSPCLCPIDP